MNRFFYLTPLTALAIGVLAGPAAAQDASQTGEEFAKLADTTFIFNTLLFLVTGFLVMWMAAGFAMLEAGMVRTKNVSMQCLKNIGLYSIAGLMFWLCGYNLMYDGVDGGFIGTLAAVVLPDPATETASAGYAAASDWFFQMVFVATAASIVSGVLAERIKLWSFFVFTAILTGFLYPITGAWKWGGGWLQEAGFQDFAGSTLVHSVGGWAALAGVLILGARKGKYDSQGRVTPMPGSNMPLATLGTFILWLGWFGFNGGSQLALGTLADASSISRIFVNTNMAAAAGVIVAIAMTQLIYKKIDLTMALNGALAGLVAITAEPLMPSILQSVIIGGVGGAIVVIVVPLLDRFRIDDVVGAIPVHLVAGIWGTMIVPWTNSDADFLIQLKGVAAIGAFTFLVSAAVWFALKFTLGIRVSEEDEMSGLDAADIGIEAYPEFGPGGYGS